MGKKYLEEILKIFSPIKSYWQPLIISIYVGLGIAVMILMHANAYNYQKEIGEISYKFTFDTAIILAITWFIIFTILSFIILVISKKHRIISGGVLSLLIMGLGLFAFKQISGGMNFYNFSYLLFESLLVFIIVVIFKGYSDE